MQKPSSFLLGLFPPTAQAVGFALCQRAKRATAKWWRHFSGWAVACVLGIFWLFTGVAGLAVGLMFSVVLFVGMGTAKTLRVWTIDWATLTPELPTKWAPVVLACMALALIHFCKGPLSSGLLNRFKRFAIFESPEFEASMDHIRPILQGGSGWTRMAVWAAIKETPRALLYNALAFGCGINLVVAATVAVALLLPLGLAALAAFLVWKGVRSGGSIKARLSATVAALKEEGAHKFAQGERQQLLQELDGAASADAPDRPPRRATRL